MKFTIELTRDIELLREINKMLKENGGYCPCALVHTKDTKCMCKEFREQSTEGPCHCGKFIKKEEQNNGS